MQKALLFILNSKGEVLIQDRRGYKKPDWGYFGGSIEEGETPLGAVIREAKEELNLNLQEEDLSYLGEFLETHFKDIDGDEGTIQHFYLYKTDQEHFEDLEAKGAHWFSFEKAKELVVNPEKFEKIVGKIK